MGRNNYKECDCGSRLPAELQFDGRGIELCKACNECWPIKRKGYNPVILGYYDQSDIDEQIEDDY